MSKQIDKKQHRSLLLKVVKLETDLKVAKEELKVEYKEQLKAEKVVEAKAKKEAELAAKKLIKTKRINDCYSGIRKIS